jgi:hypothetical protein
MTLITLFVKTVGGVKPSRPVTALEVANAVKPYLGKQFTVTIQDDKKPQDLADMVDELLGVSPGTTFDETLIEVGVSTVCDNNKTLKENHIENGDKVLYRFFVPL